MCLEGGLGWDEREGGMLGVVLDLGSSGVACIWAMPLNSCVTSTSH